MNEKDDKIEEKVEEESEETSNLTEDEIEEVELEESKSVNESEEEASEEEVSDRQTDEEKVKEEPTGPVEDTKTEEPKVEESRNHEDLQKLQNKQIKWAVFLMIGIILLIILVPYINKNFINKFSYKGLEFQKTQLGDLYFYSTRFPVVSATGQVTGNYAVNLRNDPRDLDSIPVNVTKNEIKFAKIGGRRYGPAYISFNPSMDTCEDSSIAVFTLAGFLRDSGLNVKTAVNDQDYAKENDLEYRDCSSSSTDTVIFIDDGDKTAINELGPNCYEIIFNECKILEGTERFMLIILEEYASRFISN